MNISVIALNLFFLAVSTLAGAAPIYQWTDAQGKTYFSDIPPKQVTGATQTDLQTKLPSQATEYKDHPYSIMNQVEYFQSQRERQQKMRLDQQAALQAQQQAEQQSSQIVLPPLNDGIPAIVPVPQYRPVYSGVPVPVYGHRNPTYHHNLTHGGSSLRYLHTGDHHRFSLGLGGYNYLKYWNF